MTLWRRVTPAIIRVSLISALVGTIASLTCTAIYALTMIAEHFPSAVEQTVALAAACPDSPSGVRTVMPNGDVVRAWDPDHLPEGAEGPDPEMLEEIRAGAASVWRLRFFQEYGGALLFRRAENGPCSLLEVSWRIDPVVRGGVLGMALLLALVSAVVTALLSAWVVVRPLIARVQRLGRAAAHVGDAVGYVPVTGADDDEFGQLSRQLDAAHARIRAATQELVDRNRKLESNLADVAHDLKTPLSAVQLALESLAGTRRDVHATESVQQTARRCLDDCVYLAEMIDNLRVGSPLAEGVEPDEEGARAELGEIVGQVVRRLRPLGRWRGVELDRAEAGRQVWVACRSLALERVVDNLVANAVRHGRPGDHVAVLLEVVGSEFRLTVLDDGPGLPEEELAVLGKRGFRGWGADQRAPHGTGLGLAIVTEVCRRCGWTLSFEANQPSGLRVEVRGPLAAPPEPKLTRLSAPAPQLLQN
ncbi:MAG: HAMP domain-containing histidine kinase [Myxococcaceae bacterium]|nr:HAMP domain-containing histidine kinase [Myxococcaceae bacterium]